MGKRVTQQKRLAIQFIRLAALSGGVFLLALLLLLTALGFIYQERIKTLFIDALNQQLTTEIQVGEVRLGLVRSFPLASLSFHDVTIPGSGTGPTSDNLLQARRVLVQFRIMDLLRRNHTIRQITIERGHAHPTILEDGSTNFDLFARRGDRAEVEGLQLELQRVVVRDMDLLFRDATSGLEADLAVAQALLGGRFSQQLYTLTATGDLHARSLVVDGLSLLRDRPVGLDLALEVRDHSEFHFTKGRLAVSRQEFGLAGSIRQTEEGLLFDASVNGTRLSMQHLLEGLPANWGRYLDGYRGKGDLGFSGTLQGLWTQSRVPRMDATFEVSGAELSHPASGLQLKDLNFSGRFDNGEARRAETTSIHLSGLQATVTDGVLRGSGGIRNLKTPYIDLQLYADMNARELVQLLRLDAVREATGRILADVSFQGGMSHRDRFTGQDLVKARATGSITARELGFRLRDNLLSYHAFNGNLQFRNNDLMIESFSGRAGVSDFTVSGYFRNVLPYMFLPDETLGMIATLHADRLDFDELLQAEVSEADTTYRLRLSDRLGFELDARVGSLRFRKFEASGISGTASLQNQRFYAEDVRFQSMNGTVQAKAFIDGTRTDRLVIGADAHLSRVDVHQLFYQMGNFGQTGILDENIFGVMTADVQFSSLWSPALDIDWGSLTTQARIRIEDGVLVDYEPMIALSRFLRVDDLGRVTFSTLENQIAIRNRMIYIPEMEIRSSALNLQLSGEHSFGNDIDYRLQILLAELLARKNRERRNPQEQYGDIIDDGLGRTTLFLRVTGPLSDPVFRYDHQGVREKIRDDLRQEGQNLLDVFRREFGIFQRPGRDTTGEPANPRRREMERIRKQEEGKMVIEWEDL